MRHFLAAYMWLSFAMLHQVHRIESRSALKISDPQISIPHELESEDMKVAKRKIHLEEDLVCDCQDFCLDSGSSELEVSKRFCYF